MLGAFTLDFYKNRELISFDDRAVIVIGFIAALLTALIVVRSLLDFISSRGYALFAWWRIFIGAAGLIGLLLFG